MSPGIVLLLSSAILLGGGTTSGFLNDVLVQALSLIILCLFVLFAPSNQFSQIWQVAKSRPGYLALAIPVGLVVLHLAQVMPLPTGWLLNGPIGSPDSWNTISSVPHATWAGLASLLPPLVIFFLTLTCSVRERRMLILACLVLGMLSMSVGLLQIAQGPTSGLRFYEVTNPSEAVGFFANRNHFAAWLCVLVVFVLIWLGDRTDQLTAGADNSSRVGMEAAAGFAFLMAALATLAMARSRAGILLAMIAIGSLTLIYWTSKRGERANTANPKRSRWFAIGVSAAILVATQFGLQRIMTRFETDPLDDLRWPFATTGLAMIQDYLPLGSGVGSFVQAYATVERTSDLFSGFANRVHNDWIEFAIEGGAPALVIMASFLVWYAVRVFSGPTQTGEARLQHIAGALIIALLLLHSFVDYPLRTIALSSVFAFACALLMPSARPDNENKSQFSDREPVSAHTTFPEKRTPTREWTPITDGHDWPDDWK